MPVNQKYIASFYENTFMHLICKAVGDNWLFRSDENREYFLNKYFTYTENYFETYSYCLLDNHVHWLVKCCPQPVLHMHLSNMGEDAQKGHQKKYIAGIINYEQAIEFQLKDFFISYAMAYNKMYGRSGALFINPFRRINVKDDAHFTQLVIYHHANIVKHGLRKDFQQYPWSSYQTILSGASSLIKKDEILEWFGGKEAFVKTHREMTAYYYEHDLAME
jgi:putative transposase